jgi:hypothetical protein
MMGIGRPRRRKQPTPGSSRKRLLVVRFESCLTRCPSGSASVAIIVFALTVPGCGDGLADVTGVVTLDGQPLRGGSGVRGTVYFQPTSGSGAAAVGILDENGKFSLSSGSKQGVAPGEYSVTCSATQIIPSKQAGGTPSGRRITPQKYAVASTSGFQFTVEPGSNEFDLPLTSAGTKAPGRGS